MVAIRDTPPVGPPPEISLVAILLTALGLAVAGALAILVDWQTAAIGVVCALAPAIFSYLRAYPVLAVAITVASHTWAIEFGSNITPFKVVSLLALMVVGARVFQTGRLLQLPRAYTSGVVAMLVLVAIGELGAEYEASVAAFLEFGGSIVVFWMFSQTVETEADVDLIFKVYTLNLLLTVASVWLEVGWNALSEAGTRAGGICGHPNVLGNHLAMTFTFAAALAINPRSSWGWRLIGLLAVLGDAYGEWAASSRGGTSGLAAGVFVFALLAPRRIPSRIASLVLAAAFSVGFVTLAPTSFERVTETLDGTVDLEQASSERTLHARIAGEMIPRHPVFGAGITAFGYERSRYTGRMGGALHSSPLAVAVAYGLPALLLYLGLQFSGVIALLRLMNGSSLHYHYAALVGAASAAFVSGLSGTELFRAEQWGIFSLCQILAQMERRRRAEAAIPAP